MTDRQPEPEPEPSAGKPGRDVKARVRWAPPHPSHVYRLAAETLEHTGNKILAQALRRLARCEAQDEARPNQYFVPNRQDVIEWLRDEQADIEWTIEFLEAERDAVAQLIDGLPERFKQECAICGETFLPERSSARYCSNACRQRAYRDRRREPEVHRGTPVRTTPSPQRTE